MNTTITLSDQSLDIQQMYRDVISGLSKDKKELPSKYFYDERGSRLFDRICELDEYYLTRTEIKIMHRYIKEIDETLGNNTMLVEYGSGSSEKIKILLDKASGICVYVPIDISCEHLTKSVATIAQRYKKLEILPVCADYSNKFEIPEPENRVAKKVVYFPGSTIGNFHKHEAISFLKGVHDVVGKGGALLIGVDLKKDVEILNKAYNDAKGVTAEFNLNQLRRFNRELGSNFNLDQFEHNAFFNDQEGRIEMHIVSKADQQVDLNGEIIYFQKGESIWTESSYKYSLDEFSELSLKAGLKVEKVWTDENKLFSIQYLSAFNL